jgi:hypothetical protein
MTVAYTCARPPWTPLSCVAEELAADTFHTAAREDCALAHGATNEQPFAPGGRDL